MKEKLEVIEKESTELTIEQNLSTLCAQKISERNVLSKIYERIISEEITPEVAEEARQCRLELLKNRTEIDLITKAEAEMHSSVTYRKFIIAWNKKETLHNFQMEGSLKGIEERQELIDQKKKNGRN